MKNTVEVCYGIVDMFVLKVPEWRPAAVVVVLIQVG